MDPFLSLFSTDQTFMSTEGIVRVVGIDIGTTNSSVCEILWSPENAHEVDPRCLSIDQSTTQGRFTHVLVPSVVALHGEETWVGEGAKRLRSFPGFGTEEFRSWFAETKNEMGTRRSYHRAPANLRSPRAVAAEILRFLKEAAESDAEVPATRTTVTVPASFQAAQRQDTVAAAQRAGISLGDGELLDEPIAAFLAYLHQHEHTGADFLPNPGETRNLLVFDFGGGTCDVAILRLERVAGMRISATPVTVSRYHRLGGGDIDRAIVHEVLTPQLLEQNDLGEFALGYEEKRQYVQPALLGIAEALKQKLCREIVRQKKLGRLDEHRKAEMIQVQPGTYPVQLKDRKLTIESPSLSMEAFEQLLRPFFDRDLLQPREDEYRVTCSIFAPIEDALARGSMDEDDIDLCLLVGGSSLIPQVAEQLATFFPLADILRFEDREDGQTAVAKGAALQALSLALTGKGIFRCVCHDDICLKTQRGPVVIVPRGTELPFPPEGEYGIREDLKIPSEVAPGKEGAINVVFAAGDEQRVLFEEIWKLPGPLQKGASLWLKYRLTENQILELEMGLAGESGRFHHMVENPLTHVVNPATAKVKIEDIEEELRSTKISKEEIPDRLEKLAELYRELKQHEKALAYYRRVLLLVPDKAVFILNRMAFCARDLNDTDRVEHLFKEATRVSEWSGTWFNWALARNSRGDVEGALILASEAILRSSDPAYTALKAYLLLKTGESEEARNVAAEAIERFPPPRRLDSFGLHWLATAAEIVGDEDLSESVERAMKIHRARGLGKSLEGGRLPDIEDSYEERVQ